MCKRSLSLSLTFLLLLLPLRGVLLVCLGLTARGSGPSQLSTLGLVLLLLTREPLWLSSSLLSLVSPRRHCAKSPLLARYCTIDQHDKLLPASQLQGDSATVQLAARSQNNELHQGQLPVELHLSDRWRPLIRRLLQHLLRRPVDTGYRSAFALMNQ